MPAPALIMLAALALGPLVETVWLSFQRVPLGRAATWVGTTNYARLIADPYFWIAFGHTAWFTCASVALELVLGFSLALLLYGDVTRWRSAARTLFMLPMVLSPVVVGVAWRTLLAPGFGWVNQILGVEDVGWLSDPHIAMTTIILVHAWQWTPFMFVVLLGGLLAIPLEVLEAARIDGANMVQRVVYVILPMMAPLIGVVVLLRAIDASKIFDLVFNLTEGGPGTATETLAFYMYRVAFRSFEQGYAASVSVFLTVVVGLLVLLYLRLVARKAAS